MVLLWCGCIIGLLSKCTKEMETVKLIGIFFVLLIIANLILFVFGKINGYIFWTVIIICGLVAYKVLPRLRTN